MKATLKNLANGPVDVRTLAGPVTLGPGDELTEEFDPLWMQVARQTTYFEITDKRGPGRPPKDPLDHDADGRKGGAKKAAE